MSRKGKRRREAKRERHEQARKAPEGGAAPEAAAAPPPRPVQKSTARPPQKQKPQAHRAGPSFRIQPWMVVTPLLVGGIALIAVLILTSGSSSEGQVVGTPRPTANLTPTVTLNVEAGGEENSSFFSPDALTVKAGEVFEIIVKNTGAVTHNLRLAGPDNVYENNDDFVSTPYSVEPGEEGRVVAVFEEPGTYDFRCDFHPLVQFGKLTVQ